jgi:tRNA (guanine6-N2)-methyltransferase
MIYEADVLPGLEPFAKAEMEAAGLSVTDAGNGWLVGEGERRPSASAFHTLLRLYRVEQFPIPRPKAFLSNVHLPKLVNILQNIRALHPAESFRTLRLVGAGRETEVMQRLQATLAAALELETDNAGDDLQDLLVRVRPIQIKSSMTSGWEALVSLTPRPLSARPWRVVNHQGAMNATVAATMLQLAQITPSDRIFNPCCGSGTLLAEAHRMGFTNRMVGCDNNPEALLAAQANTARCKKLTLSDADATQTDLYPASFSVFLADLPFGQRIGNHVANTTLYPGLLAEITRLAAPGARAIFLTHEIKLLEATLREYPMWQITEQFRVSVGGMHPHIFVLKHTNVIPP